MEQLFKNDLCNDWTEKAKKINNEFYQALLPIFKKYQGKHSMRDLWYIAATCANDIHLESMIGIKYGNKESDAYKG